MIRLVFFIGFLGFGGSERQLFLLLSHFDRRLFEIHVVVFNPSPNETYQRPLEQLGVQVWQIPSYRKGIGPRLRFLTRLLRQLKPDIVHSWTFHDNVYAGITGRMTRARLCWGSLRNAYHATEVQKLPAVYRQLALHLVSQIVVNANTLADELVAVGCKRQRILVLPNCVEVAPAGLPAANLSEFAITDQHQVVGIVGNLRYQKNHLLFVRGMARVCAQFEQARGLIVGQPLPLNPGVAEEIEAAIAAMGLQNKLMLTGFRPDVPAVLQRLDVLAMTSHYEGMPNVVMEAMAAARPVVATRVGGVPELIEQGVNGFIIPPDDPDQFAQAVGLLLSRPEQAKMMGAASRRIIDQKFSCPILAQRLQQLYQHHLPAR